MIDVPYRIGQNVEAILTLESDGKKSEIISGNIEELNIKLFSYGFHIQIFFSAFDDAELGQLMEEIKPTHATLTIKSSDPKKSRAVVFEHKGLVIKKFSRPASDGNAEPSLRFYDLAFVDYATKSWGSHFTKKIYIDQTMKDVIEAEKTPLISIQYECESLTKASPILAYCLEEKQKNSFYSFLMWYLYQTNGIFALDYKAKSYVIRDKKDESGTPIPLAEWDITPATCIYPEPARYSEQTIKYSPESMEQTPNENPNALESVKNDVFDDTLHILFPEQLPQKVASKLQPEKIVIQFFLKKIPEDFDFDQIHPGALIEIKGDETRGGQWCEDSVYKTIFRITEVSITAARKTPAFRTKLYIQPYEVEISITAEAKDELYVQRPEFQPPIYPFFISGMIFSEEGDEEQTTFSLAKKDEYPMGHYHVSIPLAGEEKKAVVPFTPDLMSGQFYFPHCKAQKVMLAIYFQTAKIERVLDWEPLTHSPMDLQTCKLVFASNGKDVSTIMSHEFKDGKEPVFIIKQSSSENQTQLMQLQEGEFLLSVDDKGKRNLSLRFKRSEGITLMMKDEESGITHTVLFNAESMILSTEGKPGTSTITLTPESMSFAGKKCLFKFDEAIWEVAQSIMQTAGNKIILDAPMVTAKEKALLGG